LSKAKPINIDLAIDIQSSLAYLQLRVWAMAIITSGCLDARYRHNTAFVKQKNKI